MVRDSIEICAEILTYCKIPRIKTHIIYACNLNFTVFNRYEARLIGLGMLMKDGRRWSTTSIGADWLRTNREFGMISVEDVMPHIVRHL